LRLKSFRLHVIASIKNREKYKGSDRMPGFLGEISKNKAYKNFGISDRDDLINEVIESNNFCLERKN